jgi:hypothetical protein
MCTPVHGFVILSMQRSGSGWFETLLNNHPNISSHGEIFKVKPRHQNLTTITKTLDAIYNLDWYSSASKNECTSAVGFKWMLNQVDSYYMLWICGAHSWDLLTPVKIGECFEVMRVKTH